MFNCDVQELLMCILQQDGPNAFHPFCAWDCTCQHALEVTDNMTLLPGRGLKNQFQACLYCIVIDTRHVHGIESDSHAQSPTNPPAAGENGGRLGHMLLRDSPIGTIVEKKLDDHLSTSGRCLSSDTISSTLTPGDCLPYTPLSYFESA